VAEKTGTRKTTVPSNTEKNTLPVHFVTTNERGHKRNNSLLINNSKEGSKTTAENNGQS
jgi:hypothetical protein